MRTPAVTLERPESRSSGQPQRRRSDQRGLPAGWLGAKKGDYLGELGMYAWPAN
jgi:hypothetical protein